MLEISLDSDWSMNISEVIWADSKVGSDNLLEREHLFEGRNLAEKMLKNWSEKKGTNYLFFIFM